MNEFMRAVANAKEGDMQVVFTAHVALLALNIKAMACHCECLGMNAENAIAVCANYEPPYHDADYYAVMKKWELMNEKGEPIV